MLSLIATLHVAGIKLKERVFSDERGATAVEYGIMVALIAVVIILAVTALGGNLKDLFNDVSGKVKVPAPAAT